ncbi:cell division protein FtsQ/DivIB [Salipiger sp. P9]|uniref:cell division protein FtsQ/DivIB n=1 Tax=Salipiger pentaromativorans TaxID=2943193 RepID=UPI00215723AF|nr:cell division protein FtsQ/DivIB [Salipiger pentaromativorans]MCR8546486.1 cell division protein FtsQ/DivIB [Salipiger pentaromativorans]
MTEPPASQVHRPDPAPSRLTYRIERLMLTPLFRLALRVGLPALIGFGATSWYFSYEDHRTAVVDGIAALRNQVETRPEFMVNLMAIDGASSGVAEDIREILPIDFPVSSFDLDLDHMRETISGLDAVRKVQLRIRQGGVLQIDVTERVPAVLWREGGELELLDRLGARVGPALSRAEYPQLPVVAGKGADAHVPEAVALIAAAAPLSGRLRGLERIGERRWDVVLDRGQRILLPEKDAVRALERAIAMDQAVDMLARDIAAVDLRLPQRPTLRLNGEAIGEYWRIKAMETGENQ